MRLVRSLIANIITGSGAVAKTGAATVTLSAANAYSGGTTISNGTLQIDNVGALGTIFVRGGNFAG